MCCISVIRYVTIFVCSTILRDFFLHHPTYVMLLNVCSFQVATYFSSRGMTVWVDPGHPKHSAEKTRPFRDLNQGHLVQRRVTWSFANTYSTTVAFTLVGRRILYPFKQILQELVTGLLDHMKENQNEKHTFNKQQQYSPIRQPSFIIDSFIWTLESSVLFLELAENPQV